MGTTLSKSKMFIIKNQLGFDSCLLDDEDYVRLINVTSETTELEQNVINENVRTVTLREKFRQSKDVRSKPNETSNLRSLSKSVFLENSDNLTIAYKRPITAGFQPSIIPCLCQYCQEIKFDWTNWFLPNCTRENATKLLNGKPNGTFLIRKSEKFPGRAIQCN